MLIDRCCADIFDPPKQIFPTIVADHIAEQTTQEANVWVLSHRRRRGLRSPGSRLSFRNWIHCLVDHIRGRDAAFIKIHIRPESTNFPADRGTRSCPDAGVRLDHDVLSQLSLERLRRRSLRGQESVSFQ